MCDIMRQGMGCSLGLLHIEGGMRHILKRLRRLYIGQQGMGEVPNILRLFYFVRTSLAFSGFPGYRMTFGTHSRVYMRRGKKTR